MTLTAELNLDKVELNQWARYLRQESFHLNTHIQLTDCSIQPVKWSVERSGEKKCVQWASDKVEEDEGSSTRAGSRRVS